MSSRNPVLCAARHVFVTSLQFGARSRLRFWQILAGTMEIWRRWGMFLCTLCAVCVATSSEVLKINPQSLEMLLRTFPVVAVYFHDSSVKSKQAMKEWNDIAVIVMEAGVDVVFGSVRLLE